MVANLIVAMVTSSYEYAAEWKSEETSISGIILTSF